MKPSNIAIVLLSVCVIALAAATIRLSSGPADYWFCADGRWAAHGQPQAPQPSVACPGGNPATTTPVAGNITIFAPSDGQLVNNIFLVTGNARVFENQLIVRVLRDGRQVYEQPVYAYAQDTGQYGPYAVEIKLEPFTAPTTTLEVQAFQYSAKDGTEIDKISKTVYGIGSVELMTVKAFYLNDRLDPAITCTKVFAVERQVARTQAVARAALDELLRGPSQQETADRYSTSINPGVKINRLAIEQGVAKVDFSAELDQDIGGSCRVSAIRAQIEQTLKQFPTVSQVVISVNGRTEGILQP